MLGRQFQQVLQQSRQLHFFQGAVEVLSLTSEQIERMILHSAEDIDAPGVDQVTGYGLLNARDALVADPAFFVEALISGVGVVQKDGKAVVQVNGVANANSFQEAWLEMGAGDDPKEWKQLLP